jgi:AsmA protein
LSDQIKKKKRSVVNRLTKLILWIVSSVITLLLLIPILFYIFKNDITKLIIAKIGELQNGEITFQDVSFSPFAHFPNVSLKLDSLYYYENPRDSTNLDDLPIASIEEIYVAIDIVDLIGGVINIPEVTIAGGTFNIVTYPDSRINLFNALGKEKPGNLTVTEDITSLAVGEDETEPIGKDTLDSEKNVKYDLTVDELTLQNLTFDFTNLALKRNSTLRINELTSSFIYREKRIISDLSTDIDIENIGYSDQTYLTNNKINLNTSLSFDEEKTIIDIKPSRLIFDQAQLDVEGMIDISDGLFDIKVDGSDHDFSFFSLVLSEQGVANLERGDFYFNGTIKGKMDEEIPLINFSFGVQDVDLRLPKINRRITDFNFSGNFNSGSKKNLSGAKLKIENLRAKLPNGYLSGSFDIRNFASPYLDFKWNMKASLEGFDEVIKLDFINNLAGNIEISDTVKGKYNKETEMIDAEVNKATVICKDLSFNLPGILDVQKFDGTIKRNLDQFELQDLVILAGDTDLLINGKINNANYLLFDDEHDLSANLKIKSKLFDLPNFLAFDPTIGRDFPYRIKNIDLIVDANSTTSKIDFNIRKFNATIENLLPPLYIKSGKFKISESILGFNLKAIDFKTDFIDGNLNFTAEYNTSKRVPYYVKGSFNFNRINPGKIIYDQPGDSIPEFLDGSLNGSMFVELQFPEDTTEIKLLNINNADLSYYFADDTVETKSLKFRIKDVNYDLNKNENPLATLTADLLFESNELFTNHFRLVDLGYDINCENGSYTIIPKKKSMFGSVGHGKHYLKPFDEIPFYRFQYSITQFNSEDLLNTFMEDTVITGKMDFSMDFSMTGNGWDSLVSKLNGEVLLSGKNITMYGVDTDNLLEKFKRSQSFNLVDVGAVVLAGPVGLAVTKGTDFASIIITNPGEKTLVTNLVSDYDIHDGKLSIEDVAFTTNKNRIAAQGWLDLTTDSLELTIAVLDKYGCSILSQDVYGGFKDLKTGKVKVVGAILAPVTNLWNDIWGNECEKFYYGSVPHPD